MSMAFDFKEIGGQAHRDNLAAFAVLENKQSCGTYLNFAGESYSLQQIRQHTAGPNVTYYAAVHNLIA